MSSPGHETPAAGPPELVEVADRVFAYIQPDGSEWMVSIRLSGYQVQARVNSPTMAAGP